MAKLEEKYSVAEQPIYSLQYISQLSNCQVPQEYQSSA